MLEISFRTSATLQVFSISRMLKPYFAASSLKSYWKATSDSSEFFFESFWDVQFPFLVKCPSFSVNEVLRGFCDEFLNLGKCLVFDVFVEL